MKFLRIYHLVPVSFALTVLFFTYRYVWFSVETVPSDRWAMAFAATAITGFVSFILECYIKSLND